MANHCALNSRTLTKYPTNLTYQVESIEIAVWGIRNLCPLHAILEIHRLQSRGIGAGNKEMSLYYFLRCSCCYSHSTAPNGSRMTFRSAPLSGEGQDTSLENSDTGIALSNEECTSSRGASTLEQRLYTFTWECYKCK